MVAVSDARFTSYNLRKNTEKDYLKEFRYDPSVTNPLDVARRDRMGFLL